MPLIDGLSHALPQVQISGRPSVGMGRKAIILSGVSVGYACVGALLIAQLANTIDRPNSAIEDAGALEVSLFRSTSVSAVPLPHQTTAPQESASKSRSSLRPDPSAVFAELGQLTSGPMTTKADGSGKLQPVGKGTVTASPNDPWAQPSLLPAAGASANIPQNVQLCLRTQGLRALDVELQIAPDGQISAARDYTTRPEGVAAGSTLISQIGGCMQPFAAQSAARSLHIVLRAEGRG